MMMPRFTNVRDLVLLAIFVGAALLCGSPVRATGEDRIALVIGNGAYKLGSLQNPVNDARAMTAVLMQLGFQVILRENATKQQTRRAGRRHARPRHQTAPGKRACMLDYLRLQGPRGRQMDRTD
jgi:hypothetical protein